MELVTGKGLAGAPVLLELHAELGPGVWVSGGCVFCGDDRPSGILRGHRGAVEA